MQIYPHIVKIDVLDIPKEKIKYPLEHPLTPGYYVVSTDSRGKVVYVSLQSWFDR